MAWWEALDLEAFDSTGGVLLWALGMSAGLLVAGLGIAYLWHLWRDKPKVTR